MVSKLKKTTLLLIIEQRTGLVFRITRERRKRRRRMTLEDER